MAKKTKKDFSGLKFDSFDDIDFNKKPDVQAAQKIIQPKTESPEIAPITEEKEPPARSVRVVREEIIPDPAPIVPQRTMDRVSKKQTKKEEKMTRGTAAPVNKKRASFNIDEDLHRALKEYSFFEEIDMVEYIFEELVKPDLKNKGYYPPRRRKRR